jgi:hypothetical protein
MVGHVMTTSTPAPRRRRPADLAIVGLGRMGANLALLSTVAFGDS